MKDQDEFQRRATRRAGYHAFLAAGFVAFLIHSLLAAPFLLLAFLSKKCPRISGIFLAAAAAYFFYFFELYDMFGAEPLAKGRGELIIFFFGPLAPGGLALLFGRRRAEKDEEAGPAAASA